MDQCRVQDKSEPYETMPKQIEKKKKLSPKTKCGECVHYFSVAMTENHDQDNHGKVYLGLQFERDESMNDEEIWQQTAGIVAGPHISNCKVKQRKSWE